MDLLSAASSVAASPSSPSSSYSFGSIDTPSERSAGSPRNDAEDLIDLAIENRIARINQYGCDNVGEDESFFVADLGEICRQHQRWTRNLPGVQPFYAIKCNSDPTLLKLLAELGTGFDCASVEEMRSVLSLGVDPSRIIFANPCKAASALVFARKMSILKTTFDNLDELDAIKAFLPNAQLLVRILVDDSSSIISLGDKFGAPLESTRALLARAWELGLGVVGVSFHVGSGATSPFAFRDAIQQAKIVFQQAEDIGFHMTILDVGGGFQDSNFETMAATLKEAVRTAGFPSSVRTIAEPGRYYARTAYTLVCKVISRRRQIGEAAKTRGAPDMLYQNDGVYGNFMNVLVEKEVMSPTLVVPRSTRNQMTKLYDDDGEAGVVRKRGEHRYTIWGPTCDSVDCVVREATLESEVKVGDWLKYRNMGAYTSTTTTRFNGFTSDHDTIYVDSEAQID